MATLCYATSLVTLCLMARNDRPAPTDAGRGERAVARQRARPSSIDSGHELGRACPA
jgi:hypothetical protein